MVDYFYIILPILLACIKKKPTGMGQMIVFSDLA